MSVESITGATIEHYERLGLTPGVIEQWEDGLRTDPTATSFEWWYLDAALDDGSKLTVELHTKPPYTSPSEPLTPFVSATLDRPGGPSATRTATLPTQEFAASRERCDVRARGNSFAGDLTDYQIRVDLDGFAAELALHREVPSWRPATGHVLCGREHVAWLPVVPRGSLTGSLVVDGERIDASGVGYHDHNWGTAALRKLVDHWYWGRARIDDYTVLTLNFVSHADYGLNRHPAFMVAKGGEIVASGEQDVEFAANGASEHPDTGAPVPQTVRYSHGGYSVVFERQRDIYALDFGPAGAYHRFIGGVTLEHGAERVNGEALWEFLYFGERGGLKPDRARALAHRA